MRKTKPVSKSHKRRSKQPSQLKGSDCEKTVKMENEAALHGLQQSILFEDSRFLILNKPSGMAVHGGSGVSYGVIEGLRALRPDAPYLELAHRLDRDTSGCLVIARRRSALRAFHKQQQEGRVNKFYLTLVKGQWQGGNRKINAPLLKTELKSGERIVRVDPEGKHATSFFSPIKRFKQATLMRVKLITGRTHQIRVHAQHAGHPIAGDQKYGDKSFNNEMSELGLQRLYLHAESIHFTLPDVRTYDIRAPLDSSLELLLTKPEKLNSV
jgi:23S rRNA pseudouridine955/2504/2580 synthase